MSARKAPTRATQKTRKPPAKRPPGRPPGTSEYTAKVYTALLPEQKKELERRALKRRHAANLSARWGVSDLVRELIEAYLSTPT